MMRACFAYFLALVLTVTGFSFAQARGGTTPDFGMEMVICSGVGLTTITIGPPDGEPIEKSHVCPPDAASYVVADFSMPVMELPKAA